MIEREGHEVECARVAQKEHPAIEKIDGHRQRLPEAR